MPISHPLSAKERSCVSRLRQILHGYPPRLLRASWVKMKHPCGRSYCRCAQAKQYWHLSWYVSQSKDGKPRMKSVPKEQVREVREWSNRYNEIRSLLSRIGDLYWDKIGSKRGSKK